MDSMRVDINGSIIELVLGDITEQETDAIVNATTSQACEVVAV